ncbi:hypothetical protein ABPG72_016802 [Tetrahymena utriculariae]
MLKYTYYDSQNICQKCTDSSCLTCEISNKTQQCLTCDQTKQQILYQGKCFSQISPPNNTFCKCYQQSSPPTNSCCDWNILKCQQCIDQNCQSCSDPNNPPQISLSYQFFCLTCLDKKCKTCSNPSQSPQICLSCDQTKNEIYIKKNAIFKILSQATPTVIGKIYIAKNIQGSQFCSHPNLIACQKCEQTCQTCIKGEQNDCITCDLSQNYVRSDLLSHTSSCICKEGYYLNYNKCEVDDYCIGCQKRDYQTRKCLECQQKYNLEENSSTCNLIQITEIQENYEIQEDSKQKTLQNIVVVSAILAVCSPVSGFQKQFLKIQKLNFVVLINILFNEAIQIFIQSILVQNPLKKLQFFNVLSNNWFYEIQASLNNQIITQQIGYTSITQNAGGVFCCILICIALSFPILFIEPCQNMLDNIQLIVDTLLWLIAFCLLSVLGYKTDNLFEYRQQKENILSTINNLTISLINTQKKRKLQKQNNTLIGDEMSVENSQNYPNTTQRNLFNRTDYAGQFQLTLSTREKEKPQLYNLNKK